MIVKAGVARLIGRATRDLTPGALKLETTEPLRSAPPLLVPTALLGRTLGVSSKGPAEPRDPSTLDLRIEERGVTCALPVATLLGVCSCFPRAVTRAGSDRNEVDDVLLASGLDCGVVLPATRGVIGVRADRFEARVGLKG